VRSSKWNASCKGNEGRERSLSIFSGSTPCNPGLANRFILIYTCHAIPCSLLRRVLEMPHSLSAWVQSLPQWVISDAAEFGIL